MDEALKKSGDYPNIAITPGTHRHAATGEPVEIPASARVGGGTWRHMECRVSAYNGERNIDFEGFATPEVLAAVMGRGECVFEINTDATAIRCSSCGYSLPKGTNLGEMRFCGGCGKAVKHG